MFKTVTADGSVVTIKLFQLSVMPWLEMQSGGRPKGGQTIE
jgi:hypothetical protein